LKISAIQGHAATILKDMRFINLEENIDLYIPWKSNHHFL